MKPKPDYVDPCCLILAEHFLIEKPVDRDDAAESLAGAIQNTVTLWYVLHGKPKEITDAEPEARP